MIHLVGHQGINNRALPRGMKIYPKQFNRLPYYEHLEIVHLFDTLHNGEPYIEGKIKKKNSRFVMTLSRPIMQ